MLDNLGICLPMGDQVASAFALSLAGLVASTRSHRLVLLSSAGGSIVTKARDYCIEMAETSEAAPHVGHIEWLLWLDSDMQFPPDTAERLLKHKRDIVGCAYPRRKPPHDTLGKTLDGRPANVAGGLVEMAGLGFGCLLTRRGIFKKFKKPWFRLVFDEARGETYGEDYYFCDRARELGYRIWCDVDLSKEIGHVGTEVFANRDEGPPMAMPQLAPVRNRLMAGAARV